MKIDLLALQQKLSEGALLGFGLVEPAKTEAVEKTTNVKLGLEKLAASKLGGVKTGLAKSSI
jgi:hypothetical protein